MGETVRAQLPIILSLLFLFFEAEMASDCPRPILLSFQVLMEMKGFRSSYKLGGLLQSVKFKQDARMLWAELHPEVEVLPFNGTIFGDQALEEEIKVK